MAFFKRWWKEVAEKNTYLKTGFKSLLKNGKIDFLGGGMCSNDEAAVYYDDIIRNYYTGHRFLLSEFGFKPTINW